MPQQSENEQLQFLFSCIRNSQNGKVDFQLVAVECGIVSKGAAAKRYERLMKANGINPNGGPTSMTPPVTLPELAKGRKDPKVSTKCGNKATLAKKRKRDHGNESAISKVATGGVTTSIETSKGSCSSSSDTAKPTKDTEQEAAPWNPSNKHNMSEENTGEAGPVSARSRNATPACEGTIEIIQANPKFGLQTYPDCSSAASPSNNDLSNVEDVFALRSMGEVVSFEDFLHDDSMFHGPPFYLDNRFDQQRYKPFNEKLIDPAIRAMNNSEATFPGYNASISIKD